MAAATLLVLPFSAVLSQSFVPSSSTILQTLSLRLQALFHAAGFRATSQFFSLLNLKLSQTIFSFLFCLPFTLTFCPCQISHHPNSARVPAEKDHHPLILFSPSPLPFHPPNSSLQLFCRPVSQSSSILPLVYIIQHPRHFRPVLKKLYPRPLCCQRSPLLDSAGQYNSGDNHISNGELRLGRFSLPAAGEAFLIAYIYSLLIVLDIIISYMLYRSCKSEGRWSWGNGHDQMLELEKQEQKDDLQA